MLAIAFAPLSPYRWIMYLMKLYCHWNLPPPLPIASVRHVHIPFAFTAACSCIEPITIVFEFINLYHSSTSSPPPYLKVAQGVLIVLRPYRPRHTSRGGIHDYHVSHKSQLPLVACYPPHCQDGRSDTCSAPHVPRIVRAVMVTIHVEQSRRLWSHISQTNTAGCSLQSSWSRQKEEPASPQIWWRLSKKQHSIGKCAIMS